MTKAKPQTFGTSCFPEKLRALCPMPVKWTVENLTPCLGFGRFSYEVLDTRLVKRVLVTA